MRPVKTLLVAAPLALALLLAGSALADETLEVADLRLVKSDFEEMDPPTAGDLVSYSLNVTNLGPGNATGIVVVDEFPEGFVFMGGAPRCEQTAPRIVTCDGEDLPSGASFGYLVTFRVDEPGTYTNAANVTANVTDPNLSNNADEETTTVGMVQNPPPTSLTCVAMEDGVRVTWSGGTDVDEYRVYREHNESGFVQIGSTSATELFDPTAQPDVTYRYAVSAIRDGQESLMSRACETTAVPFFDGWLPLTVATAGGLLAYAAMRRRRT